MARPGLLKLLYILAITPFPIQSGAWGNEGHTWINEVAALKQPKSTPGFFTKASARLAWLGPEPDRWRNQNGEPELKWSQEADHYIDLERLPADFGAFP